jgi:hypothetical protein
MFQTQSKPLYSAAPPETLYIAWNSQPSDRADPTASNPPAGVESYCYYETVSRVATSQWTIFLTSTNAQPTELEEAV